MEFTITRGEGFKIADYSGQSCIAVPSPLSSLRSTLPQARMNAVTSPSIATALLFAVSHHSRIANRGPLDIFQQIY